MNPFPLRTSLALLTAVVLATLSSGCATLSEQECRAADWGELGYTDGLQGQPRARVEQYAEDCAKIAIVPDRGAYFAARERGLLEYCVAENGLRAGLRGESYHDVCPPALAPAFRERYHQGRELYLARKQLEDLEGERSKFERELAQATDDSARKRLRNQLSALDQRMRQARDNILRLDTELSR